MFISPIRMLELPKSLLIGRSSLREGKVGGRVPLNMRPFLAHWKPTGELNLGSRPLVEGGSEESGYLRLCCWEQSYYKATCHMQDTRAKKGDSCGK